MSTQILFEELPEDIDDWLDSVVLLVNNGAWCSGAFIDENGMIATGIIIVWLPVVKRR